MPSIPAQIYWTEAAKRLGILYTPVFGGFSDKTLSDRIADAGARVIITADGSYRNAQLVPFKPKYTDPAIDNFVPVTTALRLLRETLADAALGVDPDHAFAPGARRHRVTEPQGEDDERAGSFTRR